MQHDVQELNRVLCDNLEEKMKVSHWKHKPLYHCKHRSITERLARRSATRRWAREFAMYKSITVYSCKAANICCEHHCAMQCQGLLASYAYE